jgi:regulator of protease activity HflC (stomatin/prohibitin superfamily)
MSSAITTATCVFILLVMMLAMLLAAAIRIVPEHQRVDIYRLGHYIGEKGPGLVFVIPAVDRTVPADLRQATLIGARGTVKQGLSPSGTVLIELNAVTDGFIAAGEEIIVTGLDKSRVRVARPGHS